MRHLKRFIPIALILLGSIWWWLPSDRSVDVTLEIAADASVLGMRDITVVVGGDKTGWAALKRGDSEKARFHPAPNVTPDLTLIYQTMHAAGSLPHDVQQNWRGPAILPGQGYRILIRMNAQGNMMSKHCVKPCNLAALP